MSRLKKNDEVVVVAGKDKGKSGKILEVDRSAQTALVEDINVVKKAVKKTQDNPQGGFVDLERPIHVSNLMLFDGKTKKPTRIGYRILKDGSKERISKKSGEVI